MITIYEPKDKVNFPFEFHGFPKIIKLLILFFSGLVANIFKIYIFNEVMTKRMIFGYQNIT